MPTLPDCVDDVNKRIHNAKMRDREKQREYTDALKTRQAIIDAYMDNEIPRDEAARLLVTKCYYGPQGAVEALNYARNHRKSA